MKPMPVRRGARSASPLRLAAWSVAALAPALGVCGQNTQVSDYSVGHKFKITTSGTETAEVAFAYSLYALAQTNSCFDSEESGVVVVPMPPFGMVGPFTALAGPVPSWGSASANGLLLELLPGTIHARYWVFGSVGANPDGCPPPPHGRGYAEAWSSANMAVKGGKDDRSGNITFSGDWRVGQPVTGSTSRTVTDPVRARLIDHTAGSTLEVPLVTFAAMSAGGEAVWQEGILSNTANDLLLDLNVPGTHTVQQGRLRLRVAGGIVTQRTLTGVFAALPLPAMGAPGTFSISFPDLSLDYNLGGDPGHDLSVEFIFDGGGETNAAAARSVQNGSLITDVAFGLSSASCAQLPGAQRLSQLPEGDGVFGFNTSLSGHHLADDFVVPSGATYTLQAVRWPIYQINAPAGTFPSAAYVRLWQGTPGAGGTPIAGDMMTNRLVDCRFAAIHRVGFGTYFNTARAVKDLAIDLSWAGPLSPGTYWIEVAVQAPSAYGSPYTPISIWPRAGDNARGWSVPSGPWGPLTDTLSGRPLDLPFTLIYSDGSGCYPDCNGVGGLTIADFGCFQTKFVAADPYADCNGVGGLTIADFGCFQTKFVAGCP